MISSDDALSHSESRLIERALSLGVRRGTAVEIGCGSGRLSLALALRAPGLHVIGVDASGQCVAQAHAAAVAARITDRVRFIRGDPKRLAFRSASFDLALCDALLGELSAILPALNEVSRVTRPAGAILLRNAERSLARRLRRLIARRARDIASHAVAGPAASQRNALSLQDAANLVQHSSLRGARVLSERGAHIIIERRASGD